MMMFDEGRDAAAATAADRTRPVLTYGSINRICLKWSAGSRIGPIQSSSAQCQLMMPSTASEAGRITSLPPPTPPTILPLNLSVHCASLHPSLPPYSITPYYVIKQHHPSSSPNVRCIQAGQVNHARLLIPPTHTCFTCFINRTDSSRHTKA